MGSGRRIKALQVNPREANQYTPLLERIAGRVWDKSRFFAVVPCTYYLGHLFWELIMAVAIARESGRSLVLLKPGHLKEFVVVNEEVFDCELNCKTERKSFHSLLMKALSFYERVRKPFAGFVVKSARRARLTRRPVPGFRFHRCGIETSNFVLAKIKGTRNYFDLSLLPESEPSLKLTMTQRERAERMLSGSDFDATKWFAAVHVRESGFRGFDVNHDVRNFSQNALLPILKEVTQQGGFVVRMGTKEQTNIPRTPGIFDYASSKARCSLVDLYVMEKCRFYVGSSAGPLAMAYAFGKPAFVVNYFDFLTAGFRKTDMFIPKMPYSTREQRFLSIAEYCERATSVWDAKEFWFVENRLEDIEEAFVGFLEFAAKGFLLDHEDQEIYREWIAIRTRALERIICQSTDNFLDEKFKDTAISTLSAPAILAPCYLRKYLFNSSGVHTTPQILERG
jgi:putative glycosyltransferase (TIGR04372 family)